MRGPTTRVYDTFKAPHSYPRGQTISRYRIILCLALIIIALLISGGVVYYLKVFVPAQQKLTPEQARAKWLEIVASRGGQKVTIGGYFGDGGIEDFRVLAQCFRQGEPAENVAAILATGKKEVSYGTVSYEWIFIIPKPKHPDATHRLFAVVVSGKPPIIEYVACVDSMD